MEMKDALKSAGLQASPRQDNPGPAPVKPQGIDLGWTTDMAALALLFPPRAEGEQWKVLLFFWLPGERISDIERRTRAPLTSWTRTGFLETTPGAEIDITGTLKRRPPRSG